MAAAASVLAGRHDFAAFRSSGGSRRSSERTIGISTFRAAGAGEPSWARPVLPLVAGGHYIYEIAGDGFLRQMVRAIVGTLVEIGLGRLPADSMGEILASRRRGAAGPTAPAHGLCLVRVDYDEA
jgi:tRNA pseudouridine38-40 synthase